MTWAEKNIRIAGRERFDQARAQPLRKWYEVAQARLTGEPNPRYPGAEDVEELYLICATGIAKSVFLHTLAGYTCANQPRRIGLYMKRLRPDIKLVQEGKLEPMMREIPAIKAQLPAGEEAQARVFGPLMWSLGSWQIYFRSANLLDDWRSEHFELILLDELERYEEKIEGVVGPKELIPGRQRPFGLTKLTAGVTSPLHQHSHGWRWLCEGSNERLTTACPSCAGIWYADWRNIRFSGQKTFSTATRDEILSGKVKVYWGCPWCGELLDGEAFAAMVAQAVDAQLWCPGRYFLDRDHPTGVWKPSGALHPDKGTPEAEHWIPRPDGAAWTAQLSIIYTGLSLAEYAARIATANQGNTTTRVTIFSEDVAEPSITKAEDEISTDEIANQASQGYSYRRQQLGATPSPIRWLLLVCDQQGNRQDLYNWPYVKIAIGEDGSTYRVDMGRRYGSFPALEILEDEVCQIDGVGRTPDYTIVDCANGQALPSLYLWAVGRPTTRLLIRGDHKLEPGVTWEEVVDSKRRRTNKPEEVTEYRIDADHFADRLWEEITRKEGAPTFHAPEYDDQDKALAAYYRSLTSEHPVEKMRMVPKRGKQLVRAWEPREIPGQDGKPRPRNDNHWFRAEIYGRAIREILELSDGPSADETPELEMPAHNEWDSYLDMTW